MCSVAVVGQDTLSGLEDGNALSVIKVLNSTAGGARCPKPTPNCGVAVESIDSNWQDIYTFGEGMHQAIQIAIWLTFVVVLVYVG